MLRTGEERKSSVRAVKHVQWLILVGLLRKADGRAPGEPRLD